MSAISPDSSCDPLQQQERDNRESCRSHKPLRWREVAASACTEVPAMSVTASEEGPSRDSAAVCDNRQRIGKQLVAAAPHVIVNECFPETISHQVSYLIECLPLVRAVIARKVVQKSWGEGQHIAAVTAEVDGPVYQARPRINLD